jgi:hypothetical protein
MPSPNRTTRSGQYFRALASTVFQTFSPTLINTTASGKNTLDMWINWEGTTNQMIFSFATQDGTGCYGLYVNATNQFGFTTCNSNDVYGISAINLNNRWLHIVAEFTNGDVTQNKLYINGTLMNLSQLAGTPTAETVAATAKIGSSPTNTLKTSTSYGVIKLFNSTLTAAQVKQDCLAYRRRYTSDIIGCNE